MTPTTYLTPQQTHMLNHISHQENALIWVGVSLLVMLALILHHLWRRG